MLLQRMSERVLPRLVLALTMCLLTWPAAVVAQDDDDRERMRKLTEQGQEAFNVGRYEAAANKFRTAYDAYPEAALLKNEMVAWYKARKCTPAVDAAEKFLRSGDFDDDDRADVNRVIYRCAVRRADAAFDRGELDKAEAALARAEEYDPDETARQDIAELRVKIEQRREMAGADVELPETGEGKEADDPSGDAEVADGIEEPTEPAPRPNWAAYGLIGGGSALVLAGGIYHGLALGWQSEYRDVAATGDDRARYDQLNGRLKTARWLVPALYVTGALTAAGGATLLLVEGMAESSAGLRLKPGLGHVALELKF